MTDLFETTVGRSRLEEVEAACRGAIDRDDLDSAIGLAISFPAVLDGSRGSAGHAHRDRSAV